ncbi:MAG: type II secretion system protein GspM [Gammaproteobacteria bacterium]|nr:type II secretion system protein GspM [Gammaproteobacteria bacterium]
MILERLRAALRDTGLERRYRALEQRERLLLQVAGAVVSVAVLYAAAFSPAHDFRTAALARYEQQQSRLDWMLAHEAEARQKRDDANPAASNRSLLTLIDATARDANVRLTRYRPESDGSVNVVIRQQPFNDVLRWTGLLVGEDLKILQAAIDAEDTEGMVNARLSIR